MNAKNKINLVYWRDSSIYLNITNKCTNNCIFCVRNFQIGVFGFNLKLDHEPSKKEILDSFTEVISEKFQEVVFTGFGEPLTRLNLVCNLAQEIKKIKKEIFIRIDTNGLGELINPGIDVIQKLRDGKIDALSISLNAENAEKYLKICKSKFGYESFKAILDFTSKAKQFFNLRFTVVDIPQIDIIACKQIADNFDIPLKIRHYSGPELII
ncbi:MAG TPA: TatD family nuclease-associated radical SAM protein [candidate division Zixibacteria bacterium]|nr:TatD family nuclease-associated radical SAM protein [candidate division Zixibacteria bacterium]